MSASGFDRLAPWYQWLERISYGPYLQWCRTALLPHLLESKSVLILGDGDGRFLEAFLKVNPHALVDSYDISPAMLTLARRRIAKIPGAIERVTIHLADVRTANYPGGKYDLIVTNFVLDCFPKAELEALIAKLIPSLTPQCQWLIGDFALPPSNPARLLARIALWGMYQFFRIVTDLAARQLVDPEPILVQARFSCTHVQTRLNGFLRATLWSREQVSASNSLAREAGDD